MEGMWVFIALTAMRKVPAVQCNALPLLLFLSLILFCSPLSLLMNTHTNMMIIWGVLFFHQLKQLYL